jgi:hypothetical protein
MVAKSKALRTTALFSKWADEVFLPTIKESWERTGYQGPALLILDRRSSHHPAEFLTECETRNIYALFLVTHSNDQCQPLDLFTFGLLKRHFTGFTFHELKSDQLNKVIKMIGAWYQTTAPHQVVSAWLSMGSFPFEATMEWFIFESIDRELEPFGGGVNKNYLHSPLDWLASYGFACTAVNKHLLAFPFKPVQHPLNFE